MHLRELMQQQQLVTIGFSMALQAMLSIGLQGISSLSRAAAWARAALRRRITGELPTIADSGCLCHSLHMLCLVLLMHHCAGICIA
jgi:hypothetical protein